MHLPDFTIYNDIAQPVFVLIQNPSGQVVFGFLNKCGCDILGLSLEDIVGQPASTIFEGRAGQSVLDRQTRAWHDAMPVTYDVALPLGGDKFWARSRLEPVTNPDGTLAYLVGISHDVSQERELEQVVAMNSAVASEMEDFVSIAAHDLRSPIANVRQLVDLVRDDFVDMGDGKLEMIAMIEQISTRALELVSDVMAQAAAANAGSEMRDFDLQSLCADILVTLDPGSRHDVAVPRARINADYVVMQIALRNLIDNALKHAGSDRACLGIAVDGTSDGRIAITVSDDGKGFADPALAFLDGGDLKVDSGFGLLGVRRLIRARGGNISARTPASGQGAEVRFVLPGQVLEVDCQSHGGWPVAI